MSVQELERSFAEFVALRQRALLRRARLLTADWAAAEDLVQTALLRLWQRWSRLVGSGQEDAYLRTVMLNVFLSRRRRRWNAETPTAELPEPRDLVGAGSDAVAAADLRVSLAQALDRLPPRQRAALVLRYVEDLSERQTAELLGCSIGTVKSQTSRALVSLREQTGLSTVVQEEPHA